MRAVRSWLLAWVYLTPLAAGVFTLHEINALWGASEDLSAGHVVDKRLDALLSTLKEAETGQRGYLLTEDRAYLKPYADALADLPRETAAVAESIAATHPEQVEVIVEMKRLIVAKTAELARTISLAEQGQHGAALAIVRADLGKQSMDAIRALFARIQTNIDADFSAATARMRTLETRSALALAVTLAFTLLLIAMLRRTQWVATGARAQLEHEAARRSAAEASRERAHQLEFDARRDAQEAIEKRRVAEENLTDSELNLSATLDSIGAGFIATDRLGRVTRMNAAAEQITGWSQAQGRGQLLWEVFDSEDKPADPAVTNPVDLLAEQGMKPRAVHRVVATSRGGVRSALEVQTVVTRREDGAPRGAVLVFKDVTREARAEAESTRLAAIVESSSDAVIGKALDGRIVSWNGAAQALFGYSAAEAIGQPVQMLMPQDRAGQEMRLLDDLTHGQIVPAFDTVRRTKGGELIHVSVAISPILDAQGHIVGASKIARDITRRHEAEAALRVSEARLHFALDAAQIGNWDLNLVTGEAVCSLRHDRCFGYETPQVDWNFGRFEAQVHPQDRAEVLQKFKSAVAEHADWRLECRVIWPDAGIHWIRVHGSRLEEDGGVATRMLGIVIDITESKRAEDARARSHELEAQNRQFQEASRLKSQFLANVSHELRTPLNAIIGFADLVHSGAVKDAPQAKHFLGHICTSGRHLLQLINDLLDLTKVESGKFEFFPEAVDVASLIREVGDILQTSTRSKKIRLRVDVEPSLGALEVDAARLKQALYNYLSNAIKFSHDGGQIAVRALAHGPAQFRIEVEDQGVGIAAEDLPRLFTDFQQLYAGLTKQHQGTGLGLALTARIVRAQGGEVGVRSTLGLGSLFYLVLDRVQVKTTQAGITEPVPLVALPVA